jgi:uncharacterized protein (DUF433 family)
LARCWSRSIQQELDRLSAQRHDVRPALEKERNQLRKQIQGWSLSLAKPDLSPAVRAVIEKDVETAVGREQEVAQQLAEVDALRRQAQAVVDAQQVVDRLNRLDAVLAEQNPSRTNLELSLHIDAIRCYQDGRVVVRTCKLGALAGSTDLLARPQDASPQGAAGESAAMVAKPRRRGVRRVADGDGNQVELQAAAHQAADVDRFAGLGPEWFWEDEFRIPEPTYWANEHAAAAGVLRAQGWTHERLARHFGVTVPTIRKALRIAAKADGSLSLLPRKMPRTRWAEQHAQEVAQQRQEGLTMKQLARQFGKCELSIRQAIRYAETHAAGEVVVEGHEPSRKANQGGE